MSSDITTIAPEEFLNPNRRLFIDTNVFMDTDPRRAAGLKKLIERCQAIAVRNGNGIVVPTKVVAELERQSHLSTAGLSDERAAAVRRAGRWLGVLESLAAAGLVRKDLGDGSNPYADDLFIEVFRRAGHRYEMCLLTNDITLRLRVRLLAAEAGHRLVAGVLAQDGSIEVDSDQMLYERGARKLERMARHIEDGVGTQREANEVGALAQLLAGFQQALRVTPVAIAPGARRTDRRPPLGGGTAKRPVGAFSESAEMKAPDRLLERIATPEEGEEVLFRSPQHGSGTLVLGPILGEGGEGCVFNVSGVPDSVVKVFDAEHRTWHRQEKLTLLLSRGFEREGIAFPSSLITNRKGEFVGYAMPRATGKELQATVMRPARFKKTYPSWTKADLVDVCISFLDKVAYLHSLNILLGDINPKNLMVDENKNVWIIDADSWQLEGYPCPVGTPMFTAPTVTGDYASALRTEQEELFAVATMLFMILITGQFPYARTGADGGDFAALIKEGKFAFQFQDKSDRDQPEGSWKYMWSHLPPKVKRTFWHTFHRDGDRYNSRPTAIEWLHVFRDYRDFFGSSNDFDPMSHDVYPTRFRAMARDTPIYECAQCGASVTGVWQEDRGTYSTPELCVDCRPARARCADCGRPTPPDTLKDGRCLACNRKRNYAACSNCGKETARRYLIDERCSSCRLVPCKECGSPTPKSSLTYGRCHTCAKAAAELDPSRLCGDCRQAFITFDHAGWFRAKGLDVPKSHSAIGHACPTSLATPKQPRASRPVGPSTATWSPTPRKSLWARFREWLDF